MYTQQAVTIPQRRVSLLNEPLIVALIMAWALVLRLAPVTLQLLTYGSITEYHTGGLFYAFATQIQANHYRLPTQIPHYTAGGLPFVYPPLSFYLAALMMDVTRAGPASILVLNLITSWLAVAALYAAVRQTSLSQPGRYAAVAAFATLPQTFGSHLPGEGLAESVGTLCLVVLLYALLKFQQQPSWRTSWWTGVFLGACVLAAPGTAYAAPLSFIIVVAYTLVTYRAQRRRAFIGYALGVVGVSLVIASPYLLHLVRSYGIDQLIAAFRAQQSPGDTIGIIAGNLLPPTPGVVPIWQSIAILGIIACVWSKDMFWVIWAVFLASVPREGDWLTAVPLAILAGYGISLIVRLPADRHAGSGIKFGALHVNIQYIVAALLAYATIGAPATILALGLTDNSFDQTGYVTPDEAADLRWLGATLPRNATLLVIGNEIEWAPILADRTVLNVFYGAEWVPGKAAAIMDYNQRLLLATSAADVRHTIRAMQQAYPGYFPLPDRIYVSKINTFRRGLEPSLAPGLLNDLRADRCFRQVADTPAVALFTLSAGCG